MENGTVLDNGDQYRIVLASDEKTVLFDWKNVEGIGVQEFGKGIAAFAGQCRTHRPTRAVIDARKLDRNSDALSWVSGQATPPGEEKYETWWAREIVPVYHEAGIAGLAVATGDPDAPGEVDTPPGVKFKMGYFAGLEDALDWPLG